MILLALDPGSDDSGLVRLDTARLSIITAISALANERVFDEYHPWGMPGLVPDVIVCEQIVSQGKHVGNETMESARWYGRFEQEALRDAIPFYGMRRNVVTNHLYPSVPRPMPASADARVNAALKTRFSKAQLRGVKGHALAKNRTDNEKASQERRSLLCWNQFRAQGTEDRVYSTWSIPRQGERAQPDGRVSGCDQAAH